MLVWLNSTAMPYPRDHAWHCACMVLGKTFPMPSVPFSRSSYCILSRLDTIDRRVSTPLSLIRRTSRHQQQAEAIWMGTNSSLEATDADGRVRTDGRQRRKARIESRLPHKSKASAMALPGVALLPLPASPDLPFVRCPPNIFLGGAQLHPNSRFGPLYLSLTLWLCA